MILQGVRHLTPFIGVCYVNDPPKRGICPVTALDLTALVKVIFPEIIFQF